ncbi:hypothetical protein [Nostoc sp. DSM 114160]
MTNALLPRQRGEEWKRGMDAGDFPNWQTLYTDFLHWCKRDRHS